MKVGIDLGTTNSVIAYLDNDNKPQIIPNRDGNRITPSVILFEDEKALVGEVAKRESINSPENTVQFIKKYIGKKNIRYNSSFSKKFTAEELSAIIIKKLKDDAEDYLGEVVNEAVITVPAYFTDSQRKATKDAGEIAGIKVLMIINEPTAAAIAYGLNRRGVKQNILVYDLGGGTFDVSVLEIEGNKFTVKATGGKRDLGGYNFDKCIVDYVCGEYFDKYKLDLKSDINAYQELVLKSEECKKVLSSRDRYSIIITVNGKRLTFSITRYKFENMIKNYIEDTINTMDKTLKDSGLNWDEIDKIILVGGATRMKIISEMIEKHTGKVPSKEINQDEAVAVGAAVRAAYCEVINEKSNGVIKITDVNSHSIGVLAIDKKSGLLKNNIIIRKNTSIPVEKIQLYKIPRDNIERIIVKVTEGESDVVDNVNIIGYTYVNAESCKPGDDICVSLSIDINGIVHVVLIDKMGKALGELEIERKTNLSKIEVIDKFNKIASLDII